MLDNEENAVTEVSQMRRRRSHVRLAARANEQTRQNEAADAAKRGLSLNSTLVIAAANRDDAFRLSLRRRNSHNRSMTARPWARFFYATFTSSCGV
ncbi:hypothetical protein ACQHIH_17070 [Xanthomonas sontii]|uniref:hypothetical protein n=1 Tax=Xanthomonas sontii TaxID=2650745 RepID=UPI003F877E49